MLEEFVLFLLCFFSVLLVYEIFIVRKAKKNKEKRPIEVKYLITRYHLNMKKVDYVQLLQIVALVSSFDISFIVSVVFYFRFLFMANTSSLNFGFTCYIS